MADFIKDINKSGAPESWSDDLEVSIGGNVAEGGDIGGAGSSQGSAVIAESFGGFISIGNGFKGGKVTFRSNGNIDFGDKIKFRAVDELILIGSATAPTTGVGIFLGKDGSDYEFRAGDPSGDNIHWDGSALNISGKLTAGELHIPDEDTTANSFHVESDGDTFWGCTQSDFTSDNDNAKAYVLKNGNAKFKQVVGGAVVNIDGQVAPIYTATAFDDLVDTRAVYIDSNGKLALADATSSTHTDAWVGFANNTYTNGNSAQAQLTGFKDGFTGLTVGSAYYIQDAVTEDQTSSNANNLLDSNPTNDLAAQGFNTGSGTRIDRISLYMQTTGTPTGTLELSIQTDSSGSPSGSTIWTESVDLADISGSASDHYYFPNVAVSASTIYYIVLDDSGITGGNVRYYYNTAGLGNYSDGFQTSTNGGSSWTDNATSAIRSSVVLNIGEIGTSPGSNSKKVGIAVSSTELLMLNS